MGKELLLGLGAVAVGAYLLFTSPSKSSTTSALDAAGSFPQFPKTSGSQFGGTSTSVSASGTITNPIGAGQNTPAPVSQTTSSAGYVPDYRSYLGDTYFMGWVQGSPQSGSTLNRERELLWKSGSTLGQIVAQELSGGKRVAQGNKGEIKLDDLFNEAKTIALATQGKGDLSILENRWAGANLSVDSVQKALYESLKNVGVR